MFLSRLVSHFRSVLVEMTGTPTQRPQVKKKVIQSRTSFYEYPFSYTAHYHVLTRYNFSDLLF